LKGTGVQDDNDDDDVAPSPAERPPPRNHGFEQAPSSVWSPKSLTDQSCSNTSCSSLYRRALKLSLDWAVARDVWRSQAVYIRGLFDANKGVSQPRQQKVGSGTSRKIQRRMGIDR
jgi:hypothetical protein